MTMTTSDDITIYIPTRGRVQRQITWDSISPKWRARTLLVAGIPAEVEALRAQGYPVLQSPMEGGVQKRQWIMSHHDVDIQGEHVVMLDDDLIFAERRTDDPSKLTRLGSVPGQFDRLMTALGAALHLAPMAGLRPRSGANREPEPALLENRRLYATLGLVVPVYRELGLRFDRVSAMEDFDVELQLLTRGHRTLCVNNFTFDDYSGSNAPGGFSLYRTTDFQRENALALAALWPGFVKTVTRPPWKGMTAPRLDVHVQWKKAYQAGVAARNLL